MPNPSTAGGAAVNLVPRGGSAPMLVSGDEKRIAKDVDRTLHDIVATAGGMDAAAAHAYVNELIKNHRYVGDVY